MADNNLSNLIPKGVNAESLVNVNMIEFMKNMKMGCTATPFKVGIDELGNYRFLIDAKPILNAVYLVRVKLDEDTSEFIVTANARRSTFEGNASFQNTVHILTATNPGIINLERLELKAALSNDIGLIAVLKSKNAISPDVEVIVSSIGAAELASSSNTINYTVDIPTSTTGLKNVIEVFDDISQEVDLNSYRRSGVVRCKPATEASRPEGSGMGMCLVAASENADEFHQTFLADDGSFHFRTIEMSTVGAWTTLFSEAAYPRIAATGRFFISLTGSNTVRIPISNVALNYDRHSVTITPENDLKAIPANLEIYRRGPNYIDVGSSNKWDGTINWTVIEAYAEGMEPIHNLTIGRLDGNDLRPATSVNEGQTIRVVLSTQNLVNNSVVPFTISGVTAADIGIPLKGQFVVKNSSAYVDIKVIEDYVADGVKTLKLTLDVPGTSASMSIKDTSTDPIFNIFFTSDAAGKNKITKLTSGYAVYVVVKAVGYRPGTEYELDFAGTTLNLQTDTVTPVLDKIKFKMDDTGTYIKEILLNPLSIDEQVINITGTTDVNLFNLYKAAHGTPTSPVRVRFVNPVDNTIVASNTFTAGVTVGNFPANSRVILENYGYILGRGGDGGYSNTAYFPGNLDGKYGGPAMSMDSNTFTFYVNNYGTIYSGGGGGGASAVVQTLLNNRWILTPIVGGVGGAPYGLSMGMSTVPDEWAFSSFGRPTTSNWIVKNLNNKLTVYLYRNSMKDWTSQVDGVLTAHLDPVKVFPDAGLFGTSTDINLNVAGNVNRIAEPGAGGSPGLDGSDSYTNLPITEVTFKGGKGGRAGYVVNNRRENVVIRNHTGYIRGY